MNKHPKPWRFLNPTGRNFPLLLLAVLFFSLSAKESGCKRMQGDQAGMAATEARSTQFLLKKLQNRDLKSVNRLNAQAKVMLEGSGQSVSANANIIWVRDSVLWLNVKKFGLEAARIMITRDSFFMLNRLEKTWSANSIESLQQQYNLPDGFGLLQQFILASAWLDSSIDLKADIKDDLHRLSGTNGRVAADYRLAEGSFLLQSQTFFQPKDARNVSFSFENYKKTGIAGQFPYLRRVHAFSPETDHVSIEMELFNVELNTPKNYRFEIPQSYEKID